MYTQTKFISKKDAEKVFDCLGSQRVLISIKTPNTSSPKLHPESWEKVLSLEFHDADPSAKNLKSGKRLFSDDDAIKILKFLKKHEDDHVRTTAICHCEAGISRSAAVSKFIARIYLLPFQDSYSLYNKHVFSTLLQVYGRCCCGDGEIEPDYLPGYSPLNLQKVTS